MFPLWLLGCLISLSGSLGAIFGTNVQKLSFRKNEALPPSSRRVYYKQTLWLCGLILVFIGGVTDFVSLAMAPQSTIAALGSVSLAANPFIGYFWLKETLSAKDIIGTILIVGGSTLSVIFGDHADRTYTAEELKDNYTQKCYIIYGSIIFVALVAMYMTAQWKLTPLRLRLVEAIDRYQTCQLEEEIAQAEMEAGAENANDANQVEVSIDGNDAAYHALGESVAVDAHADGIERSFGKGDRLEKSVNSDGDPLGDGHVVASIYHPPMQSPSSQSTHYPTIESHPPPVSSPSDARQPLLQPSTSSILVGPSTHYGTGALSSSSSDSGTPTPKPCIHSARVLVSELESAYGNWSKLHPIFYCVISGIFGAQSLLFGKSVATLFAANMPDHGAAAFFSDPMTYVFSVALACSLIGQLHFFASALEYFDALFVVPVFKCFFLTLSTLGGAFYFQEFDAFDTTQFVVFPIGFVINLFGVYVLTSRDLSVHARGGGSRESSIRSRKGIDSSILEKSTLSQQLLEPEPLPLESPDDGANYADAIVADARQRLLQEAERVAADESASSDRLSRASSVSRSSSRAGVLTSPPSFSNNHHHTYSQAYPPRHASISPPVADSDRVLLVSQPVDGVVLVASPSYSDFTQMNYEQQILQPPTSSVHSPSQSCHQLDTPAPRPQSHPSPSPHIAIKVLDFPRHFDDSSNLARSVSMPSTTDFTVLRRTQSEQPSSTVANHSPRPPSIVAKSQFHPSATFHRSPPPPRHTSHKNAMTDILVQRGHHLYRTRMDGSETPFDTSKEHTCDSSELGENLAVALTPGSSSSFTVQSPITGAEYSIPRRSSIFPHTRTYMQKIGDAVIRSTHRPQGHNSNVPYSASSTPPPIHTPDHHPSNAPLKVSSAPNLFLTDQVNPASLTQPFTFYQLSPPTIVSDTLQSTISSPSL